MDSELHGPISQADLATARKILDQEEYLAWEKVATVTVHGHEVHIHRQALDNGLFEYFAHGSLPLESEELVDVNFDEAYRVEWDSYAKSIRVIEATEHDGVEQETLHWEVAFPWPMSNRDYVFRRHKSTIDDNVHVLISKGHSHPEHPEASGVVRVDQLRNFMIIKKSAKDPAHCDFSMLYFDDLKGSIPTWLVNWAVSKAVPTFLNSLVDAAKKKKKGEKK